MRFLLASGLPLFLLCSVASANFYVDLKANKNSFLAGEKALVSVRLNTKPDSGLEFYLTATFNDSVLLPVKPVTPYQNYVETAPLTSGTHTLKVRVYLQDRELAKALNEAIAFYEGDIAAVNAALSTETNPEIIAALEARLAKDQDRLTKTRAELDSIRTHIDHQATLNLHVL